MTGDTFRIELQEQQKKPPKYWWLCLPSTGRGVRDHRGNAAFRRRQPQHRPHSAVTGPRLPRPSPHAARPPPAPPARHKFPPGAAHRRGAGGRGDVDLDDHAGSGGMRSRAGGGCVRAARARARAGAEAGGRARGGGGSARPASLRSCRRPSPEGRKMDF